MEDKKKDVEPVYEYGARVFYRTEDMEDTEEEKIGTVIDFYQDNNGKIWYMLSGFLGKPITKNNISGRL